MMWTIHGTPEIFYQLHDGKVAIYEVVVGAGDAVLEFLGYL